MKSSLYNNFADSDDFSAQVNAKLSALDACTDVDRMMSDAMSKQFKSTTSQQKPTAAIDKEGARLRKQI